MKVGNANDSTLLNYEYGNIKYCKVIKLIPHIAIYQSFIIFHIKKQVTDLIISNLQIIIYLKPSTGNL